MQETAEFGIKMRAFKVEKTVTDINGIFRKFVSYLCLFTKKNRLR